MEWMEGIEQKAGRDGDCVEMRLSPMPMLASPKIYLKSLK